MAPPSVTGPARLVLIMGVCGPLSVHPERDRTLAHHWKSPGSGATGTADGAKGRYASLLSFMSVAAWSGTYFCWSRGGR
ncbi:hypothetical protein GCM10009753_04450 [Streptantibioticus ferralitis]